MGGRGDERRPLLTTAQVSKWLGVATRTVCLWAESQEIPAFKIGRQWRFHDAAIRCWFETQEAKEKLLFPEGADLRRQAKAE